MSAMMWVLAAVAVLILGAAFVVGSGRWGAMPDVVDDRPSRLVAPGPVDAEDLREVEFSVVTRGYSMPQVDALLARLSDQLEDAGMVRPTELPTGSGATVHDSPQHTPAQASAPDAE